MTDVKELSKSEPSIHTFQITGIFTSAELMSKIYDSLQKLVEKGKYKQNWKYGFAQKGGGLEVGLSWDKKDGRIQYTVTLSRINLEILSGRTSMLNKVRFDKDAFRTYELVLVREIEKIGINLKLDYICWTMNRLDITQDFYVKSDPSLYVRILRYADVTFGRCQVKANHYVKHNEKHSAKWEMSLFDVTLYDKHKQLKNLAKKYDVPKDDIERSRNCLRYEVQLKRDYLRRKIEPKLKYHKNKYGWEDDWLVDYLMEFRKFIAPILRTTAILMFGEYEFANRKLAEFCVENLYHTGMIGDEDVDLMQDFLAWNETKPEYRRWDFDDEEWKEIHQILNLARLNRTVVPEWLLTEREKNKFPYPPFWKNIQEIKGEQFMPYL